MNTLNAFAQFVILVSLPLLFGGCGGDKKEPVAEVKPELEGVNIKETEQREGIMYLKGSDTPYTGKVFSLYENGQKWSEENYKDGKKEGLWVNWHNTGQKRSEETYKDGETISAKFWNSKGKPVDSEEESR